ncbi:Uncharacterised protein [Serratia liquefaciens]|nr:Uncharacterised protein [Serratia liquefaciens]
MSPRSSPNYRTSLACLIDLRFCNHGLLHIVIAGICSPYLRLQSRNSILPPSRCYMLLTILICPSSSSFVSGGLFFVDSVICHGNVSFGDGINKLNVVTATFPFKFAPIDSRFDLVNDWQGSCYLNLIYSTKPPLIAIRLSRPVNSPPPGPFLFQRVVSKGPHGVP